MPPRGRNRGGGGGGKQAHAGRGRGGGQERRNAKVIDLTDDDVGASTFGLPSMNPFIMNMMGANPGINPLGMPMMNPFMPMGMSTLLGPQTAGVYAPLGATQTSDSSAVILAMQQQMMMQQWMTQMNGSGTDKSVQVKMSHADLQALKMQKMQQQFAMLKAMQDQFSQRPQASAKENSATGSDLSGDVEDDDDDPPPDREMIDVAKHQAKQNEIDRRMAETISSFMAKEEYCNNPTAALEACRAAAKEATAQSTPVKEMEDFAEKVAARILARNRTKLDATAKQDSQTSQRSEETAVEQFSA